MLDRITAEILLGQFDYSQHFPNSKMLEKLKKKEVKLQQYLNGTPTFEDFANIWFAEVSVVWRKSYEHTVNSHINRLRNKLSSVLDDKHCIETVWGVGYKLSEDL